MNILSGCLVLILVIFVFSLVYAFWGWVSSLLMSIAVGAGYGIGKFIGIKPRSQTQVDSWLGLNMILQVLVEWGLTIWIIVTVIGIYWENYWVQKINYYSSAVWLIALVIDLFVLFIIGLMYGKVEKLMKQQYKDNN